MPHACHPSAIAICFSIIVVVAPPPEGVGGKGSRYGEGCCSGSKGTLLQKGRGRRDATEVILERYRVGKSAKSATRRAQQCLPAFSATERWGHTHTAHLPSYPPPPPGCAFFPGSSHTPDVPPTKVLKWEVSPCLVTSRRQEGRVPEGRNSQHAGHPQGVSVGRHRQEGCAADRGEEREGGGGFPSSSEAMCFFFFLHQPRPFTVTSIESF